jgi:hypothetical protein
MLTIILPERAYSNLGNSSDLGVIYNIFYYHLNIQMRPEVYSISFLRYLIFYSTYVDFSSYILMSVQEALNKIIDYKHEHITYICTI